MTVLVGSVGQLYQGDLDFGRHVVQRLRRRGLDEGTLIEELDYGAVAVTQRLQELAPAVLVLVGAAERGRRAGTLHRRELHPPRLSAEEVRQAVAEAVTGYVSIDLVVEVAGGLGALPRRTVTIELEPAATDVSEALSPAARAAVTAAADLVEDEVCSMTPGTATTA